MLKLKDSNTQDYFEYWLPIFKRMYFKYRLKDDIRAIVELEDNIWKNWKLTREEKRKLLKKIRGTIDDY